ncbi:MAG TPA: GNAT family N-acetyltransferase [Leptolyngbyaceae cyanobacterium M33_DOE_097]|uniref:GNAT family N-acetyltransferase n=1 Tax=Oscillatoriales cyanobacterium SpSt-418 TaxID=2282169 RepID=A0A7C3KDH3_9CYAN|nr:GNAT family N-acetyltransferase [Leptolyngbyaceae cyanobacterium M33_DOE_097]
MQPLNLRIRAATIADLDQLLAFIHQKASFDGCPDAVRATPEILQQAFFSDRPCAEAVFAEVAGQPVGFAVFFQNFSSFLAQPTLWMDDLFVQLEWRGQGIGTALVKYVAEIAQTRHCGRIEWTVATRNANGIAFYKQKGAQIREEVRLCRLTAPAIAALTRSDAQTTFA